jgi:hypothetical protein
MGDHMRNRHWLSLMVLALISAGAPARAEEFLRPGWLQFMVPKAVDHIAEMSVQDPTRRGEGNVFIYRHGLRQREETAYANGRKGVSYGDLATGLSWRVGLNGDGTAHDVVMSRTDDAARFITKTRRTGRHLGEKCTVWILARHPTGRHDTLVEENCLTTDGILLWQKIYSGDTLLSSTRAITIKRRHVSLDEVTVPTFALRLSSFGYWSDQPKLAPNDEVRRHDGSVARRLGQLEMTLERPGTYVYANGTHRLRLDFNAGGALVRLEVTPKAKLNQAFTRRPFKPRRLLTVLGERCEMYDMMPGVQDSGLTECLTQDGLSLKRMRYNRGSRGEGIAVSVSRGKMTVKDVAPPTDIMTGGWKRLAPRPRK